MHTYSVDNTNTGSEPTLTSRVCLAVWFRKLINPGSTVAIVSMVFSRRHWFHQAGNTQLDVLNLLYLYLGTTRNLQLVTLQRTGTCLNGNRLSHAVRIQVGGFVMYTSSTPPALSYECWS
ncbi:unnamed protein product [Protopolystoma xenopodis]|uniref:Uncharacterized protein n=1 Tax=Protopolystoma xenopodis TaxID=117903 RepID=A0A3S5A8D6_9PLAT|nr:unnamed protein product [Protopolystoma xenopodis]